MEIWDAYDAKLNPMTCAQRELLEETGISSDELVEIGREQDYSQP